MAEHDDGFLSRWSKRKTQVQKGLPVTPEPTLPVRAEPVEAQPQAAGPSTSSGRTESAPLESQPLPTLDDVAALTKDSDFKRFVAADVDPGVKNAAMKKLFASEPHFNVMDGLDVYIDDYNKFEPVPESIVRQLFNARTLGLLDDELEEQPKPDNAQPADEDADLQLQPHDAAGQPGAGARVAGDSADRDDPVPPRST